MATELSPAADPSLIRPTHAAFRRDLVRARMLVTTGNRRAVLGEHLVWLVGALRRHHEAEDVLGRLVLRHEPAAAPLVATMDAEHQAISTAAGALEEAAREYADGAEPTTLLTALTGLDAVLLPHLEREEADLVPTAERCVPPWQWRTWHRERVAASPVGSAQRALEVHWVLDGADPRTRAAVLARQSAVPRVLHGLRRAYARRVRELWAGTPAAAVPALTLQNYADWAA